MNLSKGALHKIGRILLKYVYKNPKKNIPKLLKVAKSAVGNQFPTNWAALEDAVRNDSNIWHKFLFNALENIDHDLATKILLTFAIDVGLFGTRTIRANRDKLHCNIPWLILMDPTSACNLKCKGCWAAEYGNRSNLTLEEMNRIVDEANQLGTKFFMLTGGEPLVRKRDILSLFNAHKDCLFLIYTNGTLVDDQFCEDIKAAGNVAIALSIEGTEQTTDSRRGDGVYDKVIDAMKLLRKHKCVFGASVCYTSANCDAVTSDEFYDMLIDAGALFALYFHYMPVGSDADTGLLLSPEQREHVYRTIRANRNKDNGKPIFVMDFQNDGEFVGGCIAGGRNYFHINSEGDAEPCVFIHYSDSNIREKSILDCLRSPLFYQYYKGQPFNDNMLCPCPMLENPEKLRKIIGLTNAKSTNLNQEETVDQLCAKCDAYAAAWAPRAKEIWEEKARFKPYTQYYRDTEEAKQQTKQ